MDLFGATSAADVHRLFFALLPDAGLRAGIAASSAGLERAHHSGGRLLEPERYHLTLRFLGDFQPMPPALVAAAQAAGDAVRLPPFELLLDHAGGFGGSRVWWLGGPRIEGLHALWRDLGEALAQAGLRAPQGAFAPHLTIVRGARRQIEPVAIDPLRWQVDGFALVHSRPGRPYEILQRWPHLTGA